MVRKNEVKVEKKYKDAVSLYADSGLSIKDICEQIGVGFSAFSSYLSKHHRDLILRRHNLNHLANVKLRGKRGQSTASHYKYKDAIAACDSQEYIEYNISQIARIFDVDCSSLANQLRRHYSDIIPRREMARRRMGIIVNLQYGARKWSREEYTKAVEVLQTSDMTIEEVADVCDVSYTGLREHILAYYPQITTDRKFKRSNATGQKIRGKRNGNWTIHEPEQGVVEKYEESVELYRTTSLDMKEIACITSVNLDGLRYHLRTWYPELIVQRRGFEGVGLENTKRYKKSTAEKYADAIERLQSSDLPTAKVAAEFGLNPETFRMYLKEHYPKLAAERGMVKVSNGRTVSCRSIAKYSEALHLYETTTESLKSIAVRLGLTYNSVGGFIRRNYPEVVEKHNALLVSSEKSDRKTMKKVCTGTKVAADKYAAAIECLKTTSSTMKDVTDKFGLNISSFRKYLYKHVPEVLRERKNRKTTYETDNSVCRSLYEK